MKQPILNNQVHYILWKKLLTIQDIIILLACVLIMGTTMGVVNVVLSILVSIVAPDLEVSRASLPDRHITALSAWLCLNSGV